MKRRFPVEFVYQVFALILVIIVVHAVYVTSIRPTAFAVLEAQEVRMGQDPYYVPERSLPVLIRDFEQEACFILMFWAFAIMGFKAVAALRERSLLEGDLVNVPEGLRILPEDTREYARNLQALPERQRSMLLPRVLLSALERFGSSRNVQDVASAARDAADSEAERLESELSMIRYIAWAIPSVGFIGTVRGIGEALAQAHLAVEGDISGVTQSLGVAFNSTFIALLISIVVMFLVHQLQLLQERLVFDTQSYVDHNLLRHMKAN
jgi:biopolymer transport protein ExbB/TolQ